MDFITDMASTFWFQAIIKLLLGFILAGAIGLERSSWSKPAGFRTHSLVGISAVLIMLCGQYMSKEYNVDPTRIPAQLLSGIGFLGAGTILRDGFNVTGLTTAAGLLAVTCIGLSIGAGFYLGGIIATVIVYVVLSYSYKVLENLDHFDVLELHFNIKSNNALEEIEKVLSNNNVDIKQIQKSNTDSSEDGGTVVILGNYNKKTFKRNELMRSLSSIEKVSDIMVENA